MALGGRESPQAARTLNGCLREAKWTEGLFLTPLGEERHGPRVLFGALVRLRQLLIKATQAENQGRTPEGARRRSRSRSRSR